jgi:hypothetical protein
MPLERRGMARGKSRPFRVAPVIVGCGGYLYN